ncbi:hypothetical protein Pla110_18100 [Polystyrenella longa]|uniref:Uncharacterized protein n=1 Tax=Polystyrenella longa TaxID=2528007 RepID=A0A518CLH6_9PLAN|nr:hypothetical protein Pla110_18100 [Polystyrenella longa]
MSIKERPPGLPVWAAGNGFDAIQLHNISDCGDSDIMSNVGQDTLNSIKSRCHLDCKSHSL